ncbi:hypothetical protein COU74_02555 [Candidatus Peregrinibacteria bacterium CG10_big_fil_rev_8_21_14_0_10_36_19]|nr:MAG: hypothetical protein COU74_02555 [Candidatus Peregrinibacteria bacterium CG10_big_fil_rev_8_21_14_0_10_36_19]
MNKHIRLTEREKIESRESLVKFMEKNPVRNIEDERLQEWKSGIPLLHRFYFLTKKTMYELFTKPLYATLVALIAVSGGTGYAAEGSLPGDALYHYKIVVNENVKAAVAFTNKAEAELAFELANERMNEAAELAAEGRLNAEIKADLESKFKSHLKEGYDDLAKLRGDENFEDEANVVAQLAADLEVRGKVLAEIARTSANKNVADLAAAANSEAAAAAKVESEASTKLESSPNVESAARGKLKATENKIESTVKFIERKTDENSSIRAEVEAELELAQESVTEGKAKLDAGEYGGAFEDFKSGHKAAQRAKALFNAKVNFEDEDEDEGAEQDDQDADMSTDIETESDTSAEIDDQNVNVNINSKSKTKVNLEF